MKKHLFLILLLFSFCTSIFSQSPSKLDSLKQELRQYSATDSVRFELLLATFRLEFAHNLDSALALANEALAIAKIEKNKKFEALALIHKSMCYGKRKLYGEALSLAIEAAKLAEKHAPKNVQIFIKSELSSYYRVTDEVEKALSSSLEILEIVKDDPPSPTKSRYYFEVGNTYGTMEDYANATKYFLKSMTLSEGIGFTPGVMACKASLMEVYYMDNAFEKLYAMYDELYPYYSNADSPAKLNKIKMFKGMTLVKEHKYAEALPYLEAAYKGYSEIGDLLARKRIAEKLTLTYAALQDFDNSDKISTVFYELKDSLDNEKRIGLTEELKEKYETEKITQEKEQAKINEQFAQKLATKNKNLFIASVIGGTALLLLVIFFAYQLNLKKRAEFAELRLFESENKLKLERKLNDAEMKALKAQMNPHFLFNAFNSIQEFIILNNRELASDYLGKFADLMRLYLDHSREKSISLENEINATSLYLELEKIRFEDTLTYRIEVAKNIDTSMLKIPPMLIQPFIENSLKHGLLHKKENRQLKVKFELEKETIICSVEDNGIGRKASTALNEKQQKKHQSFATSATQNRIELLNIGRDKDISLQIIDLTDEAGDALGTKVEIKIPLV